MFIFNLFYSVVVLHLQYIVHLGLHEETENTERLNPEDLWQQMLEETVLQSYLKNCASVPRTKRVLNSKGGHAKY